MKIQQYIYEALALDALALANKVRESGITPKAIYGVPRGGVPIAILVSAHLGVPMIESPQEGTLIVDDICDSSNTLSKFEGFPTATLFMHNRCEKKPSVHLLETENWIEFPWERGEIPAQDAITRIIEAIGEKPNREGLLDTPRRVVKSWNEIFGGYQKDPKAVLGTTFDAEEYSQMVVLRDIEMFSTCEHHMLPFFGKAHIAYIPQKRVVGLSKLARLVECFSRRLQIQERLTKQIAEAIQETLDPVGVGVVIEAKHFCMVARGVGKQNSVMTTSHLIGTIKNEVSCREEFLKLIKT